MDTDSPNYILVEVMPDGTQNERPMTEKEIEQLPKRLETPTE